MWWYVLFLSLSFPFIIAKALLGYLVCKELNECVKANNSFEKYLLDFFELYGTTYKPEVHILSAHCGELIRRDANRDEIKEKKLQGYVFYNNLSHI